MKYWRSWTFYALAAMILTILLGLAAFIFLLHETNGWEKLSLLDLVVYGVLNLFIVLMVISYVHTQLIGPKNMEISEGRLIIETFSGKRIELGKELSFVIVPDRSTMYIYYRKNSVPRRIKVPHCTSFNDWLRMVAELRSNFNEGALED